MLFEHRHSVTPRHLCYEYSILTPTSQYTNIRTPINAFQSPIFLHKKRQNIYQPRQHQDLIQNESPSTPPPVFIKRPPTNTPSNIPQVTQSQTDDNALSNDATHTPYEDGPDNYIHYNDPDLVIQTPM